MLADDVSLDDAVLADDVDDVDDALDPESVAVLPQPASEHIIPSADSAVLANLPQHGHHTSLSLPHTASMHEESAALNMFNITDPANKAAMNTR